MWIKPFRCSFENLVSVVFSLLVLILLFFLFVNSPLQVAGIWCRLVNHFLTLACHFWLSDLYLRVYAVDYHHFAGSEQSIAAYFSRLIRERFCVVSDVLFFVCFSLSNLSLSRLSSRDVGKRGAMQRLQSSKEKQIRELVSFSVIESLSLLS